MRCSIYQINRERDVNRVAFMGYGWLTEHGGLDSSLYDFRASACFDYVEGSTEELLEDLFAEFNDPEILKTTGMRSMSVSDIIVLSYEFKPRECWYCDSFGFRLVPEFCPEEAQEKAAPAATGTAGSNAD